MKNKECEKLKRIWNKICNSSFEEPPSDMKIFRQYCSSCIKLERAECEFIEPFLRARCESTIVCGKHEFTVSGTSNSPYFVYLNESAYIGWLSGQELEGLAQLSMVIESVTSPFFSSTPYADYCDGNIAQITVPSEL